MNQTLPNESFSPATSRLLDLAQAGFPVTPLPFDALAREVDMAVPEVMNVFSALKADGVIREISAIFDTQALGYESVLAALRVDPLKVEEAAAKINAHKGVSHNYLRQAEYNLWFTLAVPPGVSASKELAALCQATGAADALLLPALRTFKIGVRLDMEGRGMKEAPVLLGARPQPQKSELDDSDRKYVRVLQQDLPLVQRPFAGLAEKAGLKESGLLDWAARAKDRGWLRRYAATLNHRRAGYTENAMLAWKAGEDRIELAGRLFSAFRAVSHCYQRPSFPAWPYNLYTMVHAAGGEELEGVLKAMRADSGLERPLVLATLKEFKKRRLRYFEEE